MDFKAARWKIDANAFQRLLLLMDRSSYLPVRKRIHESLSDIQARWPSHIKKDEIPSI